MADKFNRRFAIQVERKKFINGEFVNDGNPILSISGGLTCEFSLVRNTGGSFNTLDVNLYNLDESTRRQIFQDRSGYYRDVVGNLEATFVTMLGGYGNNASELNVIFYGQLFESGTSRRGADIITYMNVNDGLLDASLTQTYATYAAPITKGELLKRLSSGFPNLKLQITSQEKDEFQFLLPVVVAGNTYEAMQQYTDGHLYVDLQKIYALKDFQVINEAAVLIDASTGLLESPRRNDQYIEITTLFEPSLALNMKIQLKSTVQPQYNGIYKVVMLKHEGTISGAVGGQCKTVIGAFSEGGIVPNFQYVKPIGG